jgi:hypothetical protein
MSLLHGLLSRWRRFQEPTPRQTLHAHIGALRERFGTPAAAGSASLPHLSPAAEYRVVVETGLSRVEIHLALGVSLRVCLPVDSLLAQPTERAWVQHARWVGLGYQRQEYEPHFSKTITAEPKALVTQVVDEVERVLFELFEHSRGAFYSVAIEREPVPSPEALLASIRQLVKRKDIEARRVVYQNLINGTFYLPLHRASEPAADETSELPAVDASAEPLGGAPVWAVFTDLHALDRFRDNRRPYLLVQGIRLIQCAIAHRIGALTINPSSDVGGELYANELEAIAHTLRARGVIAASE